MAEKKTYEQALAAGTILKGGNHDYTVVETLGQGGFGITYKVKARITLGKIKVTTFFAVKEYFPRGCWRDTDKLQVCHAPDKEEKATFIEGRDGFVKEGKRLQAICTKNDNVVQVNEVFEANNTAYFVMEYLSGGDLRKVVRESGGAMTEATMLSYLNPIAHAVEFLHDNRLLHLDIKPENVVLRLSDEPGEPAVPVLIDFGVSMHFDKKGSPTTTRPLNGVSAGYSPAEQYAGVRKFDPRFDIYALAATCYYLLTGNDPLDAYNVNPQNLHQELADKASERTIAAIVHGMSRDAANRPATVAQFLSEFRESNAMPVGHVVRGGYLNYIIMGVANETNSYIKYYASIWTGKDDAEEGSTTTNATRQVIYDLWESFVPTFGDERLPDGTAKANVQTSAMETDLQEIALGQHVFMRIPGQKLSPSGTLECEFFHNGTTYLAVRQGYKPQPQWLEKFKKIIKQATRPALYGIGALAVAGVCYWATSAIITYNHNRHAQASALLQQAIDGNNKQQLIEFAEQDSVRAYLPLALIFEQEEDYDGARNMVQKALNSGELTPEQQEQATQLLERLPQPTTTREEPQTVSNDSTLAAPEEVTTNVTTTTNTKDDTKSDATEKAKDQVKKVVQEQIDKPAPTPDPGKKNDKVVTTPKDTPAKPAKPDKPITKSTVSDEEKVTKAWNDGDMTTIRKMAGEGNKKAKELLSTAGAAN